MTLTTEQFIEKAKLVHGDRYDYSKSVYTKRRDQILIICKKHGEFEQRAGNHLIGKNCPKCSLENRKGSKLTITEFIEQANIKHNNKYSYEQTTFTTLHCIITVTCPEHGNFKVRASEHLKGTQCAKCAVEARKKPLEVFIKEANKIHDNIYTYKNAYKNYDGMNSKVWITCHIHGDFLQLAKNHTYLKDGCPKCNPTLPDINNFLSSAKQIHEDRYDYSKVDYTNNYTKIKIICKEHGEFLQKPTTHTNGSGCPSCAKSGFDPNKPATLYYFKLTTKDNKVAWKIGITNLTLNLRYTVEERNNMSEIQLYKSDNGYLIEHLEKVMLKENSQYRGKNLTMLKSNGNTELFITDILEDTTLQEWVDVRRKEGLITLINRGIKLDQSELDFIKRVNKEQAG